jgi:hypothetical protein
MKLKNKNNILAIVIFTMPIFTSLAVTINHNSDYTTYETFGDASAVGFDGSNQYQNKIYDEQIYPYCDLFPACYTAIPGSNENAAGSPDYGQLSFYSDEWQPTASGTWSFGFEYSAQGELKNNIQSYSYFYFKVYIQKKVSSSWPTVSSTQSSYLIYKLPSSSLSSYDNHGSLSINSVYLNSADTYRFKILTYVFVTGDNGWLSLEEETDFMDGNNYFTSIDYTDPSAMNWLHFTVYNIQIT